MIIHMISSLVTCHLTDVWPSRTLFRVINLVVLRKFDLKHYQGFGYMPKHTFPPVIPMAEDPYHADPYRSYSGLCPLFYVSS
jgi:hypothetical protein